MKIDKISTMCGRDNPSFRHGQVNSPAYYSWKIMLQRCTNPNNPKFYRYGGRGITVCDRWLKFVNFFADMGKRPAGMTIGRINNDGSYEPANCRWENYFEQANNRSSNRLITFNGQTKTTAQWSRFLGISHVCLRMRLHRGWSIKRAFAP